MKYKLVLIIILLIALLLRLWNLDKVPVSMFGDELDVGYHAYSIVKTGKDYSGNFLPLHFQSLAEWRTPLFIYSAVPTVAIFGITPWGVRLPAAIFGIVGVLGMYLLVMEIINYQLLMVKKNPKEGEKLLIIKDQSLAIIASLLLSISPWHIQYSRAGFEVTMLLAFYLFGLYFFFKSFKNGKWLWIATSLFVMTPLIYSTAKLFTPLLMLFLVIVWRKELLSTFFHGEKPTGFLSVAWKRNGKKYLLSTLIAAFVFGLPTIYATLLSGGTQRFGYISVFTDPTRETEVGVKRQFAARFRGETGIGLQPTLSDKLFYNKLTFWGQRILNNYLEPFSSEFLFIKGDLNLRHSIEGAGQFYKVELITLLLGLIFFFSSFGDRRIKLFVAFWILVGILPASITRDGGRHATRLILILPPLIILVSYGINYLLTIQKRISRVLLSSCYILLLAVNFIFYQQNYWTQNTWYSERWWHAGYEEAITAVKEIDDKYETVVITDKNEPPWIFFASYYEFNPVRWQEVKPDSNWVDNPVYGRVTQIDKYIFGSPPGTTMYEWGKTLDANTLFLASEKEVRVNLIREPERTPGDLELLKSIVYPSGEPAFYLFSKKEN